MADMRAEPGESRSRIPWFVGRGPERRRLEECVAAVRTRQPSVVLVTGEPGIGKTSLVREFVAGLPGITVLHAIGADAEGAPPFDVIEQLLSRLPGGTPPAALPDGGEATPPAPARVAALLLRVLGQLTAAGPVAIVLDDAHRADLLSVRALTFALRRLHVEPVLTVLIGPERGAGPQPGTDTERGASDWADGWRQVGRQLGHLDELELSGLTAADVGRLAGRLGAAPPGPAQAELLWARTEGHPLHLRTVLLGGEGPDAGDLAASVAGQVAGLPPASRRLLEAMAVLDADYPLAVVAKVAGLSEPFGPLEPLVAARLVRWRSAEPSGPVRIRHSLQRQAVYAGLAPTRRRELHEAAVAVADRDDVWRHRIAASAVPDPGLLLELVDAAEAAVAGHDPDRAARYLRWAAELADDRPERDRLLLTAVAHLLWSYRFARAGTMWAEVERTGPSVLRSCVLGRLATLQGWFGVAQRHLEQALAEATEDPRRYGWELGLAATGLASLYCWQGRGAETARVAGQALATPDLDPGLAVLAHQFVATAALHTAGPAAAIEELDRRLGLPAQPAEATGALVDGLAWRASWRLLTGELTAAMADARAVERVSQATPFGAVDVDPRYCLAWGQYLSGQWTEAASSAELAITMALAEEKTWAYAHSYTAAAVVAAGRGEWQRAEELVAAASRGMVVYGPPGYRVYPALAAAALGQARGDPAAVLRALDQLDGPAAETGWPRALRAWWLPLRVEALIATGALAEADRALAVLRGDAARHGYLGMVAGWLAGLLAEQRGEPAEARQHYEGAVAGPEDPPLYRALLEQAHGRLLAAGHDRRGAVHRLRQAYDRFVALGAAPFEERCRAALADCGLTPPGDAPAELLALTDRERTIAGLIAQGMTNTEAAGRLYLSAKTVEHHLSNIYAKLGVTSRRELRALLNPVSPSTR
jgi:DNA-binding CsgD family transcriptional regulator